MKVAVCLFGICRGDEKSWSSLFKNILEPLHADLYIHSWLAPANQNTHTNAHQPGIDNIIKFLTSAAKNGIQLRASKFEQQTLIQPEVIDAPWGKVYFSNQVNMFKSISESSKLARETKEIYDYYIFTRTDIIFRTPIIIEALEKLNCFFHGGIFNDTKNSYECEDVFFGVSADLIQMVDLIHKNHLEMKYLSGNVYNILITWASQLGAYIYNIKYSYGRSFVIYRKLNFKKRIGNIIKKILD